MPNPQTAAEDLCGHNFESDEEVDLRDRHLNSVSRDAIGMKLRLRQTPILTFMLRLGTCSSE